MLPGNDRMIATDEGSFVSERVAQVVQAIREYDHRFEVEFVPPLARVGYDGAAYRIIYTPDDGNAYVCFHVKDESQFDARVLKKIMMNDQAKGGGSTLTEYEAWEEAQRRLVSQAWKDKLEEANDIAAHVLKSPLNKYKISKDLTIRDYGNRTR